VLSAIIGIILASAFSAILVYAQELVPGKVGTMSGLFFGLASGLGGIGSAVLGVMADRHGIPFVFHACSYLPLIGLIAALLPNLGTLACRAVAKRRRDAASRLPPARESAHQRIRCRAVRRYGRKH
jgi:FSR family fosmidomycin resistance protein-like MFS transporter